MNSRYSLNSVSYGDSHRGYTTLDAVPSALMMSIYCKCGRIVVLDRREMSLKLRLDKELECMECRNIRVSHEIDDLNNHYLGIADEDAIY